MVNLESGDGFSDMIFKIIEVEKLTSFAYRKLSCENIELIKASEDWEKMLDIELSLEDIGVHLKNVYVVMNVSKKRSFQYRLLYNSIVLNPNLKRCKIKQSSNCTFCNIELETITHHLWNCSIVKEFWQAAILFIKNGLQISINEDRINLMNIIFNTVNENPGHTSNLLVLIAKQFTCRKRCEMCVRAFINFIRKWFIRSKTLRNTMQ